MLKLCNHIITNHNVGGIMLIYVFVITFQFARFKILIHSKKHTVMYITCVVIHINNKIRYVTI